MEERTIFAILITFIFALVLGPRYIKWLKGKQFGQFVREDGPEKHLEKQGTPTMGAVIYLIPILMGLFVSFGFTGGPHWIYIVTILLFAFIGGVDDVQKVLKKQNEGLTSKQKLGFQILFSLILYVLFFRGVDSTVTIPFLENGIDFGYVYILFLIFLFVGVSNATNLTDGVDGLLTGNALVTFGSFLLIAALQNNMEMIAISSIVISGLLAFLCFNKNPAQVFMGDTGSLVLGALMVVMAVELKVELLLILFGFIYVMETLSVMLQVFWFKRTGKRIFRMTPIHHHFELGGMKEKGVLTLFVIIQIIASGIGIWLYLHS